MNWEMLKPVPGGAGKMAPAISVKSRTNITFNQAARQLLAIDPDKGGRVGFARDTDTGEFYVIQHDKHNGVSASYYVQKNGKLNDVMLPVKLGVHFKLPDDAIGRIRINSSAVTHNGIKAFRLTEY